MKRTQYWNVTAGTVRTGATGHGESLTDIEDYVAKLDRARGTGLFTWGVAEGLSVVAVAGAPGVSVRPGSALDAAGRFCVVVVDGTVVVDPLVDAAQVLEVPTVPVTADGVTLPTTGLTGDVLVTVAWREVQGESTVASAPVLLHAPWLRLVPAAGFGDVGDQVPLAQVTLDGDGLVVGLVPGPRRPAGLPAGRLRLRAPAAVGLAGALSVEHLDSVELATDGPGGFRVDLLRAARTALHIDGATGATQLTGDLGVAGEAKVSGSAQVTGSLTVSGNTALTGDLAVTGAARVGGPLLTAAAQVAGPLMVSGLTELAGDVAMAGSAQVTGSLVISDAVRFQSAAGPSYSAAVGADGRWRLRDLAAATDRLAVDQAGNLGIGLGDNPAKRIVHVEGSEVHSGGSGSGFSFADRDVPALVDNPDAGQRWVWYAQGGAARLWSNYDRLSISATGEGGGLDVPRRMRVRQGGDASAGIWFHQNRRLGIFNPFFRGGDRAFVGMMDNNNVGFWGNTGVGWGLTMDTGSGDVVVAGSLTVRGTIFKGGGGFRIDHPLAPEVKYLTHSFVESPDMATLYTGTVTTDGDGLAVVDLPDYFDVLNVDPRVQLTTVGALVSVTLAEPVAGGRFTIRTAEPDVTVSWLVTGVRDDPWAQANRIAVESDKEPEPQARYAAMTAPGLNDVEGDSDE